MTLAAGGVPPAQFSAVSSTPPIRAPTPPPRHNTSRNFQIPSVPPHSITFLSMEARPASLLPTHLSASLETSNTYPPLPPLPSSYLISEFSATDLFSSPPLAQWQEMALPRYTCCYDPPSPEVKSEYDPQLPPGFFSTPDFFPSSPPPPPVPPPPRPSPPPPPTPPTRRTSGDSSLPHNAATFNEDVDLLPELAVESGGCEDNAFETCSTSSLMSSSTLTATYFQTPDSASSPLPPHALRVSPLSTDGVTSSSWVSNDSMTPSSDISMIQSLCSATQEYALNPNTSEFVPQVSMLADESSYAPVSPGSLISSLLLTSKLERRESSTQVTGEYKSQESFKSECDSSAPSEVSYTTIDTAGPAVMSSPLSTDIPSLSSLPTDPDSASSGFGSLATDTWSISTEVNSQAGDIPLPKAKPSGSTASDAVYATMESGAMSLAITTSGANTAMITDFHAPHSPSPTSTPVPSPNPSPQPREAIHLSHKLLSHSSCSEAITPQGRASPESLHVANGGVISTLPLKQPPLETTSLEHSRSYSHSFTHPPQSHYSPASDVHTSQPTSSQATKRVTTQTSAPSGPALSNGNVRHAPDSFSGREILFNMTQSDPDNNFASVKASCGTKAGGCEALPIPFSASSDQIRETEISVVKGVEKNKKGGSRDGSERREITSKNVAKDSGVQAMCKGEEDLHERVADVVECSENVADDQVVKDAEGNMNYLCSMDAHEALQENREEVRGSEPEVAPERTATQTAKFLSSDVAQPAEVIRKGEMKGHRSQEVLISHSSPVPSPSLACSHVLESVTPSLSDIPSDDIPHLNVSSPLLSLIGCNENDTVLPCSGTSSSFAHHFSASPKFRPCRAVHISSTPTDAMELLDAVVVGLESLSANLPASPISSAPESKPSESAPGTEFRRPDQPLTHNLETVGIVPIVDSWDRNPEEPKVAVCHLPLSPSLDASPPHLNPLSPALLSCPSLFTPTLLPYVGEAASCGESSHCVSSPCPLPDTNTTDPAHSISSSFWEMPHQDLEHLLSHSPCDHINRTLLLKGTSESSSEKEVIFCSRQTDFQDSLPVVCGTPSPSLHSSPQLGSLLDGQPSPSPAPCSRIPPTPPPRSRQNTPRTSLAAPLPPPRQYMLVPINQPLGAPRGPTPPPTPPRSTSVRKSSPPPPPRPAAPQLPPLIQECNEGPPLPPPPMLLSYTTPPQSVLTPVPEESSTPQSPILSKSPQPISPVSDGAAPVTINPPDPLGTYQHVPSQPLASPSCCCEDPPALPPPPDEQDEDDLPPPPPPPPPEESEDEAAPPLPLPPPPPDVLLSPPSPSQGKSKSDPSTPLCPPKEPALPDLCMSDSHIDLISVPSSDPDPRPCAVDDLAIPSPTKLPSITTSPKSQMPSSQAVDADAAPPPPPPPAATHAPSSSLPQPPCAPPPGPNTREAAKSSLITTSPYGKMVVVRSDLPLPTPEEEVRIAFTAAKDWGFLAEGEDTLSLYTQLRPVIQQGPQCGLVALSMASQVFPQTLEVEELLAAGQARGITRHGEMFSATVLAGLAEETIPGLQAEVRRDVLSSPTTLLQLLLQGDLVLVPYDAERNHQPCNKGGHRAHWGVVCGCLVQSHALTFPTGATKLDSHVDQLWHLRPRSRAGRSRSVTPGTPTLPTSSRLGQRGLKTPDGAGGSVSCSRVNTPMFSDLWHNDELKVVALWRQGKSRKVVAAPLDQLCESNDQLMSYPEPSTPQEAEYVVGSVQDGLAGQVVVLHKTKVALSDLVGLLQEK